MSTLTKLTKVGHEGIVEVKGLDLLTTIGIITTLNDTIVNLSKPEASFGVTLFNLYDLDRATDVEVLLVIVSQVVGLAFTSIDEGESLA